MVLEGLEVFTHGHDDLPAGMVLVDVHGIMDIAEAERMVDLAASSRDVKLSDCGDSAMTDEGYRHIKALREAQRDEEMAALLSELRSPPEVSEETAEWLDRLAARFEAADDT